MPLDEKSRLEKEAYAQKIMAEMKLKNEKLKERHREVQRDRERAEERNSSITTGRNPKKETDKNNAPRAKKEREWDRGKPDPDSVEWDSSQHHDYYSRNTRSYSDRRIRKDDGWRSRSTNSSSKPTSSFFSKYQSNKNETIPESSTYRSDTNRFNSRSRSQYYSNTIKSHATTESNDHSYPNSKACDHSKKSSEERFSPSVNYSESKREPVQNSMDDGLDELMWQCGSMNEVQHKLSRIENWVKSININHGFTDTNDAMNKKEDYEPQIKPRELSSHCEKPRKYGSVENSTTKNSEEQTHFQMKEKSDQKFNPPFSNLRGRGNRMYTGDRCSSVSDSKKPRDVKRKNLNERCRRKCESDMSDRASSMKESDDFDWKKDKTLQAGSNSKFPENSWGRGRGKRMEPSGSHRFENLKSIDFKNDAWKEEKQEENVNKQSTSRQSFMHDNVKDKYGSKSLPSHDSSKNYEYKSYSGQRSTWKKTNNNMNNRFQKNKSESGWVSNSGNINKDTNKLKSDPLYVSEFWSDSNSDCHEAVNDKNKLFYSANSCPKEKSDQLNSENSHLKVEKKYSEQSLKSDPHFVSELWEDSNSDSQIIDNCNDLKKHSVKNSENGSDYLTGECRVYENSSLQGGMNTSDIYRKNIKSAENIIISLQCKQNDSQIPFKRKVSVNRYSHKKTLSKFAKLPQKSNLFAGMKVTDKSLEKNSNFKNQNKVLPSDSENSVHDRPQNISFSDQNLGEPDGKPVSERKRILTDNVKLEDETNTFTLNLSDDEWTTVTDDEDENGGIGLTD